MQKRPKPIVLTVLDGWGYRAETRGNAIALARKPNYDRLLKDFPNTLIHTSGPYVGLPEGQMGNSEVGHMNMGAGRIIHMDITRIDLMIANGEFFKQPLLLEAMERGRARNLHLLGLLRGGEWRASSTSSAFSSTASWMAATRRHIAASNSSNNCSRKFARPAAGASPRSQAATTPWTATIAGSASSALIAPSFTAILL